MTLIEIVDTARDILNEPLDSTRTFPEDTAASFWKDSTLIRYFNWAQKDIARTIVQSFENYFVTNTTISLVADQEVYAMPTNSMKIVRVEYNEGDNDYVSMLPMTLNDKDDYIDRYATNVTSTGRVQRYAIAGNQFIFRPIPKTAEGSAVTVWFSKIPLDLTTNSDVTTIPEEFREPLVWGIVHKALFQQEATGQSTLEAKNEYNKLKQDISKQAENRQVQRSRHVRRRKFHRS